MINVLMVISILLFCILFTGIAKVIGVGFVLWVITVFWNMHLMLRSSNMNVGSIALEIDKKYDIAKSNKKRGEQLLYGITIPIMVIGLIMVIIIIIMFFTVL